MDRESLSLSAAGAFLAREDHQRELIRSGWIYWVDGCLNMLLGAARQTLCGHVEAVAFVQDLIPVLLPESDFDDWSRRQMRSRVNRALMRDTPLTSLEAHGAEIINSVGSALCGRRARPIDRAKLSKGLDQVRSSAQREVFRPPADLPLGAQARAWEAGLADVAEDVIGDGARRGSTLRQIIRAHRGSAARRARSGIAPDLDPQEHDRERKRRLRGKPIVTFKAEPPQAEQPMTGVDLEGQELIELFRDEVTTQEWESLRLHGAKLSDREIGRRLGIDHKTARRRHESGLSKILAKAKSLGVLD